MAAPTRPEIKSTLGHRFATDTAIAFRQKRPTQDQPPNNVPSFPGQLVAVQVGAGKCKLFVGSEDMTAWLEVS